MPSTPLRIAVVCRSNVNRSMEAHCMLQRKGFDVRSFGTSSHVKLPGPSDHLAVRYTFGTTYEMMAQDLLSRDRAWYTENGLLHVLGRNARVKAQPERFQESGARFDVIFTCDESVYDDVVQELYSREQETLQPVHVVNVSVEDTLDGATVGALRIVQLCQRLQQLDDLEGSVGAVLLAAEEQTGESFLHTVCFY